LVNLNLKKPSSLNFLFEEMRNKKIPLFTFQIQIQIPRHLRSQRRKSLVSGPIGKPSAAGSSSSSISSAMDPARPSPLEAIAAKPNSGSQTTKYARSIHKKICRLFSEDFG
jgi:hypothetical protein